MGGVVGGILVLVLVAISIFFFFLKRRRRDSQREINLADSTTDEYQTTPKYEKIIVHEMNRDCERPFELGADPLCEAELGQVTELESGEVNHHSERPVELGEH